MAVDLFAGARVRDDHAAKAWYEVLLGGEPSNVSFPTEAVWELAEQRSLYIERETYGNGVRKVIHRDPDRNEIGFRGMPL